MTRYNDDGNLLSFPSSYLPPSNSLRLPSVHLPPFVYLFPSPSLRLPFSLHLPLSVYLPRSISLCLHPSLYLPPSTSLYLPPSIYLPPIYHLHRSPCVYLHLLALPLCFQGFYDYLQAFKTGLHNYLTKFAYKNTFTEDLWDALEAASGKPVREVMSTWTSQMGFPVLKVSIPATTSVPDRYSSL